MVVVASMLSGETNADLLVRFRAMDSAEQLRCVFAPLRAAGLVNAPCEVGGWPAAKQLWSCANFFVSRDGGAVATLRDLLHDDAVATADAREADRSTRDEQAQKTGAVAAVGDLDELPMEAIVLGHPQCRALDMMRSFLAKKRFPYAVLPVYAANYLQDEQRYELHVLVLLGDSARGEVTIVRVCRFLVCVFMSCNSCPG